MKMMIKNSLKVLLIALMLIVVPGVGNTVHAESKELAVEEIYYLGDTIAIDGETWIKCDDHPEAVINAYQFLDDLTLPSPQSNNYYFNNAFGQWFIELVDDSFFYFGYGNSSADKIPTGIKCNGGDGSQDNPYTFELVYDMTIKEVSLTVTPPAAESSGSVKPAVSGGAQLGGSYYISDTSWCDPNGGPAIIEKFVSGNDYYALITLKTNENYYWNQTGQGVTTNVNGATLTDKVNYVNSTEGCSATIVVKVIPTEAKKEISSMTITVGIPKVGDEVTMDYKTYIQNPNPDLSFDQKCHVMESETSGGTLKQAYWIDAQAKKVFEGVFEEREYIVSADIEPDNGYTFAENISQNITVSPESNVEYVGSNVVINPTTQQEILRLTLKVTPEKEDKYYASKGDGQSWQKGSSSGLSFTFDRSVEGTVFGNRDHIEVDGSKVDPTNYTEEEGSWVVELKASYLESLSVGEHTIEAKFVDYIGPAATAKFSITEKKEEKKEDSSSSSSTPYKLPKTGIE